MARGVSEEGRRRKERRVVEMIREGMPRRRSPSCRSRPSGQRHRWQGTGERRRERREGRFLRPQRGNQPRLLFLVDEGPLSSGSGPRPGPRLPDPQAASPHHRHRLRRDQGRTPLVGQKVNTHGFR